MAASPTFTGTPRFGAVAVSTAETNFVSLTNFGAVLVGGASGTVIEQVVAKAGQTTAAGLVRIYVHDGTTNWIVGELPIAATSASNSTATAQSSLTFASLRLPGSGHTLRATTTVGQLIHVSAYGGDL